MKPSGINANQFTLLSYLMPSDGLPHGELAALLGLDRTTLTRNLQPLIREGYLREDGAQDQRVRIIVLTEKGRTKRAEALPLWQSVQSRHVDDLGEADWQILTRLLGKIRPLEL